MHSTQYMELAASAKAFVFTNLSALSLSFPCVLFYLSDTGGGGGGTINVTVTLISLVSLKVNEGWAGWRKRQYSTARSGATSPLLKKEGKEGKGTQKIRGGRFAFLRT